MANLISAHRFAPGQSGGVIFFDINLQLRPDTQISFDPVHLLLISKGTKSSGAE